MVSWEGMLDLPELESNDPFVVMSKAMKAKSSTTRSTTFPSTSRPPVRARSALSTTNKSTTLSRKPSRSTIAASTSGAAARPVKAPLSRAPRPATAMSTTSRSTRAPRPATALSSRAPISRRLVVPKPSERSRSVVGRPKVADKQKSDDGLAFNVEKSTSEDFLFAV
ncbi:hypothetical protein BDZ89DRAFT_263725 [Hymenopellis radicata]|nr:hypothetical protein BDZ89DRAFT_263725 [Hymenopellis radicata]